jgi:hypothetical protein
MIKRFTPSKKDIEKLNKYLKNGKDIKPVNEGTGNNRNKSQTNK